MSTPISKAQLDQVQAVIQERSDRLIDYLYLEDPSLKGGRTCKCCAVGALIQALPAQKFAEAIELLNKSIPGISAYSNTRSLRFFNKLRTLLATEYDLTDHFLEALQATNDQNDLDRYNALMKFVECYDPKGEY